MSKQILTSKDRRTFRVRKAVRKSALTTGRARLSIHRTGQQIYAQVIDDTQGVTIASASSIEKGVKAKLKSGANVAAAAEVGKLVAERAVKAGVKQVVFDRGSFLYHGRVKALADGARAGGLDF
jgi:large subunit ribosomal protein L18